MVLREQIPTKRSDLRYVSYIACYGWSFRGPFLAQHDGQMTPL